MNALYNHSKVKAHLSFTRGEGFGRPLLEATISGKPMVVSAWSGHVDFLNKDMVNLIRWINKSTPIQQLISSY